MNRMNALKRENNLKAIDRFVSILEVFNLSRLTLNAFEKLLNLFLMSLTLILCQNPLILMSILGEYAINLFLHNSYLFKNPNLLNKLREKVMKTQSLRLKHINNIDSKFN